MVNVNIWSDIADAQVLEGDCLEKMKTIPSNSIDAIITDPPYGIGFMGKKWDASVPALDWALECLRVLKPGGHIVAFASTRTYHRLAVNLEDAGFQIRDMLSWVYYSGFPKNLDISKQIDKAAGAEREVVGYQKLTGNAALSLKEKGGTYASNTNSKGVEPKQTPITKAATEEAKRFEGYGTALKPAQEPACLARKPIEKGLTVAQNVLKWGTGAINIDKCRFPFGDPCWIGDKERPKDEPLRPRGGSTGFGEVFSNSDSMSVIRYDVHSQGRWPANLYQCPKASRTEREQGLSHLTPISGGEAVNRAEGSPGINNARAGANRTASNVSNFHPTVKPIKLFRWLCRLLGGEKGNLILDPFLGSGTTAVAALLEGYNVIGCEREKCYIPIIHGRIEWAIQQYKLENAQLPLFGEAL